ncbi:MAG: TolC family protein [Halobacteriovoraceae bacterium]|nr:TolC family protein [Halobacteriovoraceae bacterium]
MKKLGLLSALLCFSNPSFASLKNIAKDFLENNAQVKVAESQVELAALDVKAFELTRNTNLTWNSERNNNKLESFSAFAARFAGGAFRQPIESTRHNLELSKDFNWGGSAAITNSLQAIDVPGAQKIYGFTQGISYTQNLGRDFFGRTFYLQKDQLNYNLGFTKANSENDIQNSLLSLVQNYFDAALQKSLVKLQSEAKSRAKQRMDLIEKRVRDGLREKVDRIQAEISLYQADENVKSAEQNFTSAIERLSTSVHREVPVSEITGLIDTNFAATIVPKGQVDENKNLKALQEQLKANKATFDRSDLNLLPNINLNVQANSNNFDPETSTAFSDGMVGSANHEFIVGVNLTWALGSQPEKIEKTRALVNYNTSKLRLEKLTSDVAQTEKSIVDQVALLDKNLESSKRRLRLAKSALKEYNRLYARGRADLDQLIQAEETLINTEINHVQYLSQRERLVHSLAFLYGKLRGFLIKE